MQACVKGDILGACGAPAASSGPSLSYMIYICMCACFEVDVECPENSWSTQPRTHSLHTLSQHVDQASIRDSCQS